MLYPDPDDGGIFHPTHPPQTAPVDPIDPEDPELPGEDD